MEPNSVLSIVLTIPAIAGILVAAVNSDGVNDATERVEAWARTNEAKVRARRGKFSRLVVRPLLLTVAKFSDWTDGFAHRGLKNGARLTGTLYLGMAWLYLMFVLIQVLVAVVIVAAIVVVLLKVLSNNADVRRGFEAGQRIVVGNPRRGESRESTDFWGNPRTEHFNRDGRKVGESRDSTDFWYTPRSEHYDRGGRKAGESRDSTDFWGNPRTEHYDRDGRKTGESRDSTDFWGNPQAEHYDRDGRKTGESRDSTDFWGNPRTEHRDRDE
jgi:hypothetical protein